MQSFKLKQPETPEDFEKYFELRWRILRKPWDQPRGSEQDDAENSSYHIMAVHNNTAIGVARLQFPQSDTAQLRYMAVDPHYHGQGTGRAIVDHMENYARQHSACQLFLHARENAVGFYLQLGYGIADTSYLLFDTIQHYLMVKKL